MTLNPLLSTSGIPDFMAIKPESVAPAMTQVLKNCETILNELEAKKPSTWDELVPALDEINRQLHRSWGPVSHLLGTMNSADLRKAHEAMQPKVVDFSLRYSQSQAVYEGFKHIKNQEWSKLSRAQQRVVDANIKDAELSGIALTGEKKERFNAIAKELSKLTTTFSNNVLDSVKAYARVLTNTEDVAGLPASALALLSQAYNANEADAKKHGTAERGPWRMTLDMPSYIAFMQHGTNRGLREVFYREYIARASKAPHDNTDNIRQILRLRQEKARLLGFKSYAELSLAKKMAPGVEAVDKLSNDLLKVSLPAAKKEFKDLEAYAQTRGYKGQLSHWDIPFWTERLREERFQYTDEELKPYFALPNVLAGLFNLVEKLFAVRVEAADGEAPVWHKDVRYFKIYDTDGSHRASFFLDPYSRPETKRGGAWMDDCLGRDRINGKLQVPVAYLICNSTPPVGDTPSLMTFQEVTTVFHEFGHGLQHMLTSVEFPQAAGISGIEWDAVELPSQFMENWCYHKPTMMQLAKHYQTGALLPDALFEKICAAKNFMSASFMIRQIRFGTTDMELHHNYDPHGAASVFDLAQKVAERTAIIPPLSEDRMLCSFSHIFAGGYAAGYYSYKWAEVLSADAFAAFEEAGLSDEAKIKATGKRFRDTILALGGGEHPMDVFKTFRGREPKVDAILRHSGLNAS